MIARNLKAGRTSDSLINYALEGRELGHQDKKAEIVRGSNDLILPHSVSDKVGIKELKDEFANRTHEYLKINPDNKNALIGHQILSFTEEDFSKLGKKGTERILDDYIKSSGLDKTKYVAISHGDTKNPHFHIIYHKVQNDMKKENDWKLNNKTIERGVALALQNKLRLVKNQKVIALTKGVLDIRVKHSDIKDLRNSNTLLKTAKNMHHFDKLLEKKGIKKENLKDDRIKVGKQIYRESDLNAVFMLNRQEKMGAERNTGFLAKKENYNPLEAKKASKTLSFVIAPDQTEMSIKAPTFSIVTIKSKEPELRVLRRKRKGKSYLLKNKKQVSQSKQFTK